MLVRRTLPVFLCLLVTIVLTSCSTGPMGPGTIPIGNSHSSGSVHGGQQPVVGATIQLYTVGTTADGSVATPLLTSTVTSDASGSFSITGLYSCTNATQVYIVATGGNPGLSTTNPNIALMAALGPCSSLTASTFIIINELTTVAAVSALAPYMSSISGIGSSISDAAGLASAFTLANQLVNTATGTSPGANLPPGYTVPATQLNTLADILSACINSTGGSAGDGSLCGSLFSLTAINPNPAPSNTIQAMLNIANNPTLNISALYALTPPTPPFQPTLTSAPGNFQVQLTPPAGSTLLQVSPFSINFPSTAVSFTSQPQTVTLQNPGVSTLELSAISVIGADASDFAISDNRCLASLDAGASCTFQVSVTPSANGARNASLLVSSNSPGSPQIVPLSVDGTAPSAGPITLSTTSLSFTLAGVLQDVTVSNYGSTPLTISSINVSEPGVTGPNGYFAVANSTCGTSLPAQSVCTISIVSTYASGDSSGTPISESGTLTIADDASTGPQTVSLSSKNLGSIAGSGSNPLGVASFAATQLGTTETIQAEYRGYNAYDEAGWPSISVNLLGTNPSDFTESITQNGTTINNCTPGMYGQYICYINFTFTPSAAGSRTAKAFFPSGYVLLSGTGVGPGPSFRVDQTSLSLGSVLPSSPDPHSIGTSTVTVTNNGTTTISVGASFTGANPSYMSANTSSCSSVAPQTSCGVTISFSAPATGSYSANLILKDTNSSFSSSPIPISAGTGYWSVAVFPGTLTFSGSQVVGTTSAAQNFVLADPNQYPIGHPLSVTLQPSSNFVLTQGSTCPASSTQTCTLAIEFAPQASGNISETATITDQTTGLQTFLYLNGTSIPAGAPAYTLSSSSVTFPSRPVNSTSLPITVTLTSSGTQTLNVSGISINGVVNNNFTQTNGCAIVPANSTCSINITFAPTATGLQSATLQINSNAVGSPNTISLTGTATP